MRSSLIITALAGVIIISGSCSRSLFQRNNVYQAPRMGAEYRFEEGLRREKRPQHLFSKKERKEMEKLGMTSRQERAAPPVQIKSSSQGAAADSTRTDSTSTPPVDSMRTDTIK